MCFLIKKIHACRGIILDDCAVLIVGHRMLQLVIGESSQRNIAKEIGAWRVERKGGEKPRFPINICEDYTESWLVVRAKALYNSYVSPPCTIIQIVSFWFEAFHKVFSCLL